MIMTAAATNGSGPSAKRAGIGTLIGVYALIDLPVGIAIMLLAWWGRALLVWAVAAALLFIINIAACGWIQREWDRWMSGSRAARFEARLQKWREGRLRRVVNGVTGGSVGWFILSSVITNAIITVSLARLVSGKPVPGRKVLVTVVAFAILFSGLWAFVGWVLNDAT
jgi:hypothetical protein